MNTDFTDEQVKGALVGREREAEELLRDEEATSNTLEKAKKMLNKIKKIPVIGGLVDDITTTIELIGNYVKGNYKEVPLRIVVSALACIIYLISPIDLIPDVIPVIGFADDAAVIALVLSMGLSSELGKYRKWKTETARQKDLDKARTEYAKKLAKELEDHKNGKKDEF